MKIYISPEPPFGVAPPKQANRPPPTPEMVMETAALAEAMMAFHSTERPSGRQLSRIARHLRHNPELRRHPVMEPYLDAILDRFVADYPPLAPGSVAKGIMVEFWMKHAALSISEAHRCVAKLLKMSVPTLREACRVFRIANRRGEKASGK